MTENEGNTLQDFFDEQAVRIQMTLSRPTKSERLSHRRRAEALADMELELGHHLTHAMGPRRRGLDETNGDRS